MAQVRFVVKTMMDFPEVLLLPQGTASHYIHRSGPG